MDPLEYDLKIRFQPKQSELWDLWNNSKVTRLGFGGARGGAKSGGGRRGMLLRRLEYPQTTGLILRRTLKELEQSHLLKIFEEFPAMRGWYREQKKQLLFPNGSSLFFGSAQTEKDMADFYSSEYADIMPDECQEFSQVELEKLSGSNRCTSNPNIQSKMIMTFMPSISESGIPPVGLPYLKRVFIQAAADPNLLSAEERKQRWAFIQAFGWDNIEWARKALAEDDVTEEEFYDWDPLVRRAYFLERTDYGSVLAAITDKNLRDAWLDGKWDVFQGQYFANFSKEKHVLSMEAYRKWSRPWNKRWLSLDWGFDHPHAAYWHEQDERGVIVTYREQWGRHVSEEEVGKLLGQRNDGDKLIAFPLSWDAGKQSPRSQPKFPKSIMQLLSDALPAQIPRPHPADSSPGSRIAGARLMSNLLDADMWQITEDCTHLIECLPSLVRNPDNTEDVLKVDYTSNYIGDDPYDAARMGLQYMLGKATIPIPEAASRRVAEFAKQQNKSVEEMDINSIAQLHRRASEQERRRRNKRRGGLGRILRPGQNN